MVPPTGRLVGYEPRHRDALIAVARQVRAADPAYPPFDVPDTAAGLGAWLDEPTYRHRWVLIGPGAETGNVGAGSVGAGSVEAVLGHVGLTAAEPYLTAHLGGQPGWADVSAGQVVEVARLFLAPAARGLGYGARLMAAALAEATRRGQCPALAVLDASTAAIGLYRSLGLCPAGSFTGRHGLNHVFVGSAGLAAGADLSPR